jgi:hypothetical protein
MNLLDLAADYAANPAKFDAKPELAPIPNGPYTLVVNKAEEKPYLAGYFRHEEMVGACAANPSLTPGKRVEIELEILDEGPYKGRKIWLRKVTTAASDDTGRGNKSAQECVDMDCQSLCELMFKRLKITPAEITPEVGYAVMTGRMGRMRVSQYQSKGKTRNDISTYIDVDNASAPVTVKTTRPVVASDDEASFWPA